uniref:Sushi domain-containing protein n=1 Tax=Fundulus heteroclitus TaxID=8078 RepID=A0A3Q2U5F8_FUNHE
MGVAALFLLSSLCLFAITAQAQQCSKPSGGPNMDLKPEYILNTTFEDGATVAFSCNPGYTPAGGSPTITCTAGLWSEVLLRCERKNCGALEEVANGEITYINGTEFGDTAKVTCKLGYNPVGGSAVMRCDVEGWTGRLPTCEVVKCVPPGGIVNGTFSPMKEFYEYREVVQYSCNKDLELNGSRELICSEDGNFSPAPPNCVWVECKDPVIENAELQSGSRPPHRLNAALIYICKTGYTMEGPSTVTCDLNSQWSPSLPKCNTQQCSKPSGGPNMDLRPDYMTQTTFEDGATVAFTCHPGYTPVPTITCTAGQWSAVQLRCEKKNCGALPEVTNGEIIYTDGTEFGDTAKVQCEPGYYPVGGSAVLRCGVEGWMGRLPTCEAT